MTCPIARTLDIVGEWWTLLIVRDALLGARRFDEFRDSGIADNILSSRLDRLVQEEILERRAYQEHPPRHEYVLTEKGRDLLPVIAALGMWGHKWVNTEATPPRFLHARCGTEMPLAFVFSCPACGEAVQPAEIRLERSDPVLTPAAANSGHTRLGVDGAG